jgi:thiosulfate reductase cytochrome b subunit
VGNRGFVGLHTVEGYLLITILGLFLLASIVAGAWYMHRTMRREAQLRKQMRDELVAQKAASPNKN